MTSNSSSSMAPPPPESSTSALESVETKISPSILFVVAVLAVVFFVCGLLHLLVRHLLRLHRRRRRRMAEQLADGGESATAFQGQLQQLFHLHDAGVDQAFIDALPVFLYKNVVGGGANGDGGGKDAFDCAVCLCEFAAEDELRLLPSCSHAFHVECIDTWLLSHSTCPLCRSSLLLAELSPPARGGPVVVMVLESESPSEESESSPEMADAANSEPSGVLGAEEVVEVKLGKFMCVEGNGAIAIAPSAGDVAGAAAGSSSNNGEAGLGQRRCHSMGSSYEYVMEEHASLRVSITKPPPKKTKHPAAVSKARGAMSECELGASLRLPPFLPTTTTSTQKHLPLPAMAAAGPKLIAKDSFSVSKIWMVPRPPQSSSAKRDAGPGERRTVSFRWPVKDEEEGRRKSGSETEWAGDDVESCGGNSAVSAAASLAGEQRPSFARRTLLWVVGAGGRPQTSNRVGSCS